MANLGKSGGQGLWYIARRAGMALRLWALGFLVRESSTTQ